MVQKLLSRLARMLTIPLCKLAPLSMAQASLKPISDVPEALLRSSTQTVPIYILKCSRAVHGTSAAESSSQKQAAVAGDVFCSDS